MGPTWSPIAAAVERRAWRMSRRITSTQSQDTWEGGLLPAGAGFRPPDDTTEPTCSGQAYCGPLAPVFHEVPDSCC